MSHNQLKDTLRYRVLTAIRKADSTSPMAPKVVVVDNRSVKLLNTCTTTTELCSGGGITGIVHLLDAPTARPDTEAIYFVYPTPDAIARICQDFALVKPKGGVPSTPRRFKACHLVLTYELDDQLFGKLKASLPADVLKTLDELYVSFQVVESQIFRTESSPQTFYNLFSPHMVEKAPLEMEHVARQLVSLCSTLHINPLIRYHQPDDYNPCKLSREAAVLFQTEMDKFLQHHTSYASSTQGQTVCLILDRSVDLYTPFLHEFTYQAMCMDLLNIQDGGKYQYDVETGQGMTQKEVILDDEDPLWVELRHKHIMEVRDILHQRKEKLQEQQRTMSRRGDKVGMGHLRTVVSSLPEFEKELARVVAHDTLLRECFEKLNQGELGNLANLEQILVTGKTAEGEVLKNLEMELVPLIDSPEVSATDKLRLLMIYFIAKNGSIGEADRTKLMQVAQLSSKQRDTISNLRGLGFQFDRVPPAATANSTQEEGGLFGRLKQSIRNHAMGGPQNPDEDSYNLSRYVPRFKKVVDDHLRGQLDDNEYPLLRPPQDERAMQSALSRKSLRSVKATWARPGPGGSSTPTGTTPPGVRRTVSTASNSSAGKMVIFVVGGVTYSEIRATYELSQAYGWDIYLGSTHILSPLEFLHSLSGLHEIPSHPPGGLPLTSTTSCPGDVPSRSGRRGMFGHRFGGGHSSSKPSRNMKSSNGYDHKAASAMTSPRHGAGGYRAADMTPMGHSTSQSSNGSTGHYRQASATSMNRSTSSTATSSLQQRFDRLDVRSNGHSSPYSSASSSVSSMRKPSNPASPYASTASPSKLKTGGISLSSTSDSDKKSSGNFLNRWLG
ncbi:syntaxin binding protein 1 [Dispira parvispora]|uniref:Syntaxin binding protein 1 n=1 Tax=Dispira parvispora TaxID=1520584 RepID=A0A9W8AUE1_9FUNG|nr:syntaxin binding protein 1 [Dispira parvispora]